MARLFAESNLYLPDYIAALRYAVRRDAQRFIVETHQDISDRPPSDRRTLVLFAHFDAQGIVDPYVVYYLQALYDLGSTIVFVSGSPHLDEESVDPIRELCAGIYTRETLALDFGSWHLGWDILQKHGWSLDDFDRLVITNDSNYGPLYPLGEMWQSFRDADMYGAIESRARGVHLQSFFLAWDLNSRTRPFLNNVWNKFQYVVDKDLLIRFYEVGLSKKARKAGLRMKPYITADAANAAAARASSHQWARLFPTGKTNYTLFFWDGLIEQLRFPFLKTVLPRRNDPWHDSMAQLPEFIDRHTSYPYSLIEANMHRLQLGEKAWKQPADPGKRQA